MMCGYTDAWSVVERELLRENLHRPLREARPETALPQRAAWLAIQGCLLLHLGRLLLTLGRRLEGYATVSLAAERR